MMRIRIETCGVEETARLGATLAGFLGRGSVLALTGELGAGKTQLVKGLARGLGIDPDDVTSPTFTIIAEHHGRLPLYHMDFYRLSTTAEAAQTGIEEYLEGDGLCAVEWADRLPDVLPSGSIWVELAVTGPAERAVTIRGEISEELAAALGRFHP